MKIGVVSDTHGLFRPEVFSALDGVERILHLGDVGKIPVLDELRKIAPVTAVRGNVDLHGPCSELPETEVVTIGEHYVYLLHNLDAMTLDPAAGKFGAVLFGHSHVPNFYTRQGVLYFNPGSCGPLRFRLKPSVGLLTLNENGGLEPRIISLDCAN
jgi:hypothetical protein